MEYLWVYDKTPVGMPLLLAFEEREIPETMSLGIFDEMPSQMPLISSDYVADVRLF